MGSCWDPDKEPASGPGRLKSSAGAWHKDQHHNLGTCGTSVLLTCASCAEPVGSAVWCSAWLSASIARFFKRAAPLRAQLCATCRLDLVLSIDLAACTPSTTVICLLCLAASMASSLCHKLLLSSRHCCFLLLGMGSPSVLLARARGSSSSYDMLSLSSWRGCFAIVHRHSLSLRTFLFAAAEQAVIVLPAHFILSRHGGTLRNLQQSGTVVQGVADATWPDPCIACRL